MNRQNRDQDSPDQLIKQVESKAAQQKADRKPPGTGDKKLDGANRPSV